MKYDAWNGTLGKNSLGLKRLMIFKLFTDEWREVNHNNRFVITIKEIYLDYGANMMYTGLLTKDYEKDSDWQSFSPRDWNLIANCDSIQQLHDMAYYYMDKLVEGKICVSLYEIFE